MSRRTAAAAALLAAVALASGAGSSGPPVFPLSQVRPGLTGHGLSVFAGTEPRRFEVEVVGVLERAAPGTSYILARLAGEGLERTGVIAGMSGSPVYLDGRLAGAVAFAFPFAKEALAGITPVESMRAIPAAAGAASGAMGGSASAATPLVALADLAAERWPADLLERSLAPLAAAAGGPEPGRPGILWAAAGWPAGARGRREAAGLAAAGLSGSRGAAAPIVPGSAAAALLVDGDFQLAATGTVTEREGDTLLAFGHPLFGLGPVSLPLAGAEVIAVVPSQSVSFKLANVGPVAGAWTVDHAAGVRGQVGRAAPQLPVTIEVRPDGAAAAAPLALRVAEHPLFTPGLTALGLLGALDLAGAAVAQSVDLELLFRLAEGPPLAMRQSFDGPGAGSEALLWQLALHSYLALNPLAPVRVAALEVRAAAFGEPRGATVIAAHPERTVVRPGERLGVEVVLSPHRRPVERRRLELALPADLPPGRYPL
ncbi:MAG TPA: SpoIVB peptidase S55 domain-containing protein, partial [Thermoanaerobaculia bacterium]|nr:SpoIVB peptidase S55 domain-containing protein [Thermoanaerobaculia bacterium]